MTKPLVLSHTQIEMYKECPQKYYLHYRRNLREDFIQSPLIFGSALDKALNVLLLTKKKNLTIDEQELLKHDPNVVFKVAFRTTNLNGEDLPTGSSLKVRFNPKDSAPDLLQQEDLDALISRRNALGFVDIDPIDLYTKLQEQIKSEGFKSLSNDDRYYLNYFSYLSLIRKGYKLIEIYKQNILPMIDEVIEIQKPTSLKNEAGDCLNGFIDIIAKINGQIAICDNKTSSEKYAKNSVATSQQLAIYTESEGIELAAYLVITKNPKIITQRICPSCNNVTEGKSLKNCKECKVPLNDIEYKLVYEHQVVGPEKISDEQKDKVFAEIDDILNKIKREEFPEDRTKSCMSYGRKCAYYDYCRDGSMDSLFEQKKR